MTLVASLLLGSLATIFEGEVNGLASTNIFVSVDDVADTVTLSVTLPDLESFFAFGFGGDAAQAGAARMKGAWAFTLNEDDTDFGTVKEYVLDAGASGAALPANDLTITQSDANSTAGFWTLELTRSVSSASPETTANLEIIFDRKSVMGGV
ncbi:hypothetical protein DIPPA_05173 [Diplonema papillatum]|nr:hypothetical protein DIPPA_05173 [Diplonema papillatum]